MQYDEYDPLTGSELPYLTPAADPYAERPAEDRNAAGLYRSGETYSTQFPEFAATPSGSADGHTVTVDGTAELSHQALARLRARLVRKYH
jgi:hypothetical protein